MLQANKDSLKQSASTQVRLYRDSIIAKIIDFFPPPKLANRKSTLRIGTLVFYFMHKAIEADIPN